MSSNDGNLIDLTTASGSRIMDSSNGNPFPANLIVPIEGRDSLDSNPFDKLQKQIALKDDPFEVHRNQLQPTLINENKNVPTDNLLCLDEELNKLSIEKEFNNNLVKNEPLDPTYPEINISSCSSSPSVFTANHHIFSSIGSPSFSSNEPSPLLINLNENRSSEASASATINTGFIDENTENSSSSTLNKGFVANRSRIQSDSTYDAIKKNKIDKLRASNSLDTSCITPKGTSKRTKLLKLSLVNATSPYLNSAEISANLSGNLRMEAFQISQQLSNLQLNDSLKSSEEDLMSINPPNLFSDSAEFSDLDQDLEQMKIPMLENYEVKEEKETQNFQNTSDEKKQEIGIRLEKIKQNSDDEKQSEIPALVFNLVSKINILKAELEDCCDGKKQEQAKSLLDRVSSLLTEDSLVPFPLPIVRQGTFDVEKTPENINESSVQEKSVRFDPNIEYSSPRARTSRSQSLSLHDKPTSVLKAVQNRKNSDVYSTPVRTPISRSSFSASSSTPPVARRSILGNDSPLLSRKRQDSPIRKPSPKKFPLPKPPTIRSMVISDTRILKPRIAGTVKKSPKRIGPLRAMAPLIKLAPMITTKSVSSPIEDAGKLKPITSTPKVNLSGFPKACSTPMIGNVSPSSVTSTANTMRRMSYISQTPKPQKTTFTIPQHRRSMSDSKNQNSAENSSKLQVPSSSISRLSSFNRTPSFTSKMVSRLPSSRLSSIGSGRDLKENKIPK